jgi:hypothetical protein
LWPRGGEKGSSEIPGWGIRAVIELAVRELEVVGKRHGHEDLDRDGHGGVMLVGIGPSGSSARSGRTPCRDTGGSMEDPQEPPPAAGRVNALGPALGNRASADLERGGERVPAPVKTIHRIGHHVVAIRRRTDRLEVTEPQGTMPG